MIWFFQGHLFTSYDVEMNLQESSSSITKILGVLLTGIVGIPFHTWKEIRKQTKLAAFIPIRKYFDSKKAIIGIFTSVCFALLGLPFALMWAGTYTVLNAIVFPLVVLHLILATRAVASLNKSGDKDVKTSKPWKRIIHALEVSEHSKERRNGSPLEENSDCLLLWKPQGLPSLWALDALNAADSIYGQVLHPVAEKILWCINELNWVHTPLLIFTPMIALHGLMTLTIPWQTWVMAMMYYHLTGMAITTGYHRLWAHKSFEAATCVKVVLALLGAGAFEGSIRWWARDHRAHHRYTDTDKDPYNARAGLFYSHLGWMLLRQVNGRAHARRY